MYKTEDTQGYLCPVDNSGEVLEQGGACPSPPGTLAVPPLGPVTSEGVGSLLPTPKVNPSRLPLNPAIDSVLTFFAPRPGVGDAPPCSPVKVGVGKPENVSSSDLARFKERYQIPGEPSPFILNATANLDAEPGSFRLYPSTRCKLKYIVLECGCMKGYADGSKKPNRKIVPSTCMSLDCAPCAPYVGYRRLQSVLKRLMGHTLYQRRKNTVKTLIYTIFTVPKAIREQYLDKAEWQKARKRVWTLLKEYFGALYGVEVTHPIGDKDRKNFHPHLNFLWVQKSGFKPFIDVDLLRKKWGEVLKVDISDVYSQYTTKVARIVHWIKYVTRTFPGTHKWTGSMRWYGKYPKEKVPVEYVCNECGCHFRLIGYVSGEDVDNWYKRGILLGIDPPWERDECITHLKKRKPLCT